jgi:hypothetical protein
MDYALVYKEKYSESEKEECKIFVGKLYSAEPYGIGLRRLNGLESVTLEEICSTQGDVEERMRVEMDLLTFYRTGRTNTISSERIEIMKLYFGMFVGLMRKRILHKQGIPFIMDMVLGEEVEVTARTTDTLNRFHQVMYEFNDYLRKGNLFVGDDLTIDAKSKILNYIQYGVANVEVMYLQACMYYNLNSDFVFDEEIFELNGNRFFWQAMLGMAEDEVIDFPIVEVFLEKESKIVKFPMYVLSYCNYETICDMKYYSKYNYKLYAHKRRIGEIKSDPQQHFAQVYLSVGKSLWCAEHLRTGCSFHGLEKCFVISPNLSMVDDVASYLGLSKGNYFEGSHLVDNKLKSEFISIVLGLGFSRLELLFVLLMIDVRVRGARSEFWELSEFSIRMLKIGSLMSRENICFDVRARISLLAQAKRRKFVDHMKTMDPRKKGLNRWSRDNKPMECNMILRKICYLQGWECEAMEYIGEIRMMEFVDNLQSRKLIYAQNCQILTVLAQDEEEGELILEKLRLSFK